jgi:lacto-N-neotetraose biosynthesis glycosyl transferase lgtA
MKPLVSVLICAYNAGHYFAEALEAVLGQTYRNLEIVLVNDGSTDDTLAIAKDFQGRDGRIRIISNSCNLGFIASLNIGLDAVKGTYIARTDADDIVSADWIEKIVGKMEEDANIIAMGSYLEVLSEKDNNSVLSRHYQHGDIWTNPLTHDEITAVFPFRNCIHNNSMIMRRTIIDKGLRFDPSYLHAEDYKFWYEVSKLGKLANYPEALVQYRFHQHQVSSLYNKVQVETAQRIKREIRNSYLKNIGIKTPIEYLQYEILKNAAYELYQLSLDNDEIDMPRLFLYEYFLSMESYRFIYLIDFLTNKFFWSLFTGRQIKKIVKKFVRPKKYSPYFK